MLDNTNFSYNDQSQEQILDLSRNLVSPTKPNRQIINK